ncbi:hypothetical protein GCM10010521_00040 [Streptomyces rameus]|uniref:Uncharacterized protein n=1 Tax=Streptomyces rameus TaxID=68261 RepID=A0ABP6MJ12_9ACTN
MRDLGSPVVLWPAWSARPSPQNGSLSRTIHPAQSYYLLFIGGTGDFPAAVRLLHTPVEDLLGSHMPFRLTKRGHFGDISLGLSARAITLTRKDRRSPTTAAARSTTHLLPLDAWTQLCRDMGFEAGGRFRRRLSGR